MVKTLPFNAGCLGSIPGVWVLSHIPHGQKTKTENQGNIVTNSMKTFKVVHSKKKKKKKNLKKKKKSKVGLDINMLADHN